MLTVTKETAIKLNKLGWNKLTMFCFIKDHPISHLTVATINEDIVYYAPTLEELLNELPDNCILYHTQNGWYMQNENYDNIVVNPSPVEAAAELWIKIHENI